MNKSLTLALTFLGLVACTKSKSSLDFCKYADSKWQYRNLGIGQGITGCEVSSVDSKKMDMMGQKVVAHEVKLKLKIGQVEDACESKQGRECNILLREKSCVKENGKKADWCKYPDAKVVTAKGKFIKDMNRVVRLYEEDGGQHRVEIFENKELK